MGETLAFYRRAAKHLAAKLEDTQSVGGPNRRNLLRVGAAAAASAGAAGLVSLSPEKAEAVEPDPLGAMPWDIILCLGQSNQTRTDYTATYYTESDDRVLEWDAVAGAAGVTASGQPDYLPWSFSRAYARDHLAYGRRVVYLPLGKGETGFSSTSLSGQAGYTTVPNGTWDRNLTADPKNLAINAVAQGQAALAAAPAGSRFVAILWSQGEQDRGKARDNGSSWYSTRVDDLFTWLRTSLAVPNLPILVSSMTPETIADTILAGNVNAALLDTPRRVKFSAYIYGPENMSKYNEPIHWATHGHTRRGQMFSAALNRARLNNTGVGPTPPLNLRVERTMKSVTISWEPPVGRATNYVIAMSTDTGTTWQTIAHTNPIDTKAFAEAASDAPVWVRAATQNEIGTSSWSTMVQTGGIVVTAPAPDPGPSDGIHSVGVSEYTNRWLSKQQTGGAGTALAAITPHTGTVSLVQANAGKRPTIAMDGTTPVIRFDGVDDDVSASGLSTTKTITLVCKVTAPVGKNTGILSTGANFIRRTNETTPRVGTQVSTNAGQYWPYPQPELYHVITIIADGTTGALSIDGGYKPLNGATANTQILLGRYGTTNFGQIDVLEVVSWDRALTESECGIVSASLKAGYPGLT